MTFTYKLSGIINFCLFVLVAGCASGPAMDTDKFAGVEVNDKTYDVLFATEFPVESVEDAIARGSHAIRSGEVDKALFFYVRALQLQPDNVELMAHIGSIHMRRNDFKMAKRVFLAARSHDPVHAQTLEGLGLIYLNEGLHEAAISALTLAIANDDQLWRAHSMLGVYADKAGDFKTALFHYDTALSINPNAAHVLNNRGYSKYLAGDNHGAALDFYEAAKNQGFTQSWANLGRVYAGQGWYDSAIETYREVMSEEHALNNTAKAAIQNGDFEQAKNYLDEAIRISPTYFPAAEENLASLDSRR